MRGSYKVVEREAEKDTKRNRQQERKTKRMIEWNGREDKRKSMRRWGEWAIGAAVGYINGSGLWNPDITEIEASWIGRKSVHEARDLSNDDTRTEMTLLAVFIANPNGVPSITQTAMIRCRIFPMVHHFSDILTAARFSFRSWPDNA